MGISSQQPEIILLREAITAEFGRKLIIHNDFLQLADDIFRRLKEHVSETTLERVWNYSTRGYSSVSIRTLNVLSQYCGHSDWDEFCKKINNPDHRESDFFDEEIIDSQQLQADDRLKIGWLPDRLCVIRYLGDNRFIAEECLNSTMKAGDTFYCPKFQLHQPLFLENFNGEKRSYGIGLKNGLTLLQKLP